MTSTTPVTTQAVISPTTDTVTLIRTIKVHLAKGDKAAGKANEHYLAAGLHLKKLKDQHFGTWGQWVAPLEEQVGIGKSRASELMQIADGRKTVEQVRSRSNTSSGFAHKKSRQSSPLISGEIDQSPPTPETSAEATTITPGQRTYPSPQAAHGRPIPEAEDDGAGVTLVPALEADADAPPYPIERIRELEIKVEELEAENTELRRQLNVYQSPVRCGFVEDDGGREAAGYGEAEGDCVACAITIATGKPYTEVFEELVARHNSYVKRLRPGSEAALAEKRRRSEPIHNGCSEKVYGPYLKSLGWQYTRIEERKYLRAGWLPSGHLIVHLDHHLVALIDGVIRDTYDSGGFGKRPVKGYWSQAAEPNIEANIKQADQVTA